MATFSSFTPISQATDADFRTWITEFSNALTSVGLIQTSDTGQINKATVVRVTGNNDAGYEIFRFADLLQSTSPVFIRVMYGSAGTNTIPRLRIQIGTATDGAGNLTGIVGPIRLLLQETPINTTINIPTRISYNNGILHVFFKIGIFGSVANSTQNSCVSFSIFRETDSSGTLNGNSVCLIHGVSSSSVSTNNPPPLDVLNYTLGVYYQNITGTSSLNYCFAFREILTGQSYYINDTQVFRCFVPTPLVIPTYALCGVLKNEYADFSTFQSQILGGVNRTYLVMPNYTQRASAFVNGISNTVSNSVSFAILWE